MFTAPRRTLLAIILAVLVLAPALNGQQTSAIPQDTGDPAIQQQLRKLNTTARLLHITAHPDDEDGAMLTLEARGRGVKTMLLTLTRGEGGQNRMGSTLFDALGVLRTLELLAADKYYGVEQRFTRVADFGFSKNAQETFDKWRGHDVALADMVRVIREFRPDVIVSRFGGTRRDGHGHHEAAGILAGEAFRAAADPKRFPEQLKQGLLPWQAKKFYISAREGDDWTLSLNTDEVDPVLGMSYAEFAMQGLKHQLSQGASEWSVRTGPRRYKLEVSVLPPLPAGQKEKDFFDGIDVAVNAPVTDKRAPRGLGEKVATVAKWSNEAHTAYLAGDKKKSLVAFASGAAASRALIAAVSAPDVAPDVRANMTAAFGAKAEQFNMAAAQLIEGSMDVLPAGLSDENGLLVAAPGESFTVQIRPRANWAGLIPRARLVAAPGWRMWDMPHPGGTAFRVSVPEDAAITRPNWQRSSPETDTIYRVASDDMATIPLPPLPLSAQVTFLVPDSELSVTITQPVPVIVAPRVSVTVAPLTNVIPSGKAAQATLSAVSNVRAKINGEAKIDAPQDFVALPPAQLVSLTEESSKAIVRFPLATKTTDDRRFAVHASVNSGGSHYVEGFGVVARQDLVAFPYYQLATERVSVVNVKLPPDLRIGYVMGAGDDIPEVLRQIGLQVEEIKPQQLKSGDLSQFGTIVLGIRAYDVVPDLRANNQRLLDFVSNGGTLVVQYNADVSRFNDGHLTPYPAELSRDRVTVEEAKVEVLAPDDPLFRYPNAISARDFDGWVQERGLYFMNNWDSRFEPLLSCSDPGEPPMKGGLLRAKYGRGTYIYTGYAFFRQLPFGVPGAVRLFVNMVSAGHQPQTTK